jgi:hypothetical protein
MSLRSGGALVTFDFQIFQIDQEDEPGVQQVIAERGRTIQKASAGNYSIEAEQKRPDQGR